MSDFTSAAHFRFSPRMVAMRLAAVRLAAVLVAWACVQPQPAWAQATVTWNGATDTTWSQPDTTSWSGATYSSGDTAVFAGSGTGTVTITAGGVTPGQTNVTGGSYTFSGGPLGGSGGIAKGGSGTLTLSGSNTYSGTTTITAGVLNIQHASALGGTAAGTTVASGAALQIQGGITVTGESLSLIGTGIASDGALRNISGSNTWTGAIGIDGVGAILVDRDVSPHNFIASDAGLLTLSGPLQIAAPAASGSASSMLVRGNGNVVISGNISGGKAGNVSFASSSNGTGTRTLSGSNSYLGWTIVNGNVTVEGGSAIPDASRVVSNSPGRLVLNANETIGGLASSSTGTQINLNSHTLTIGADNTTPLETDLGGATYLGTIIGTGGIVKVGTGVLTLSASNSYSGTTSITAGVLNIQNASALGGTAAGTTVASGAALQIQGGITVTGESLSLIGTGIASNGALRNISGSNTWTGAIGIDGVGAILVDRDVSPHNFIASDAGLLTLSGPLQIAAPAASGSASSMLVRGNGNVVISGNISGGKAGNLSFTSSATGTGTRTLSGSNSYLGWTAVNGNLTVEGGSAIPDASRVVSNSPGRLVLNANETIGGLASSSTGTQINLNSHTLTIGADNTTPLETDLGGATYLGTIIGTGGIAKVGSGTLTLSGSVGNTYTGMTSVTAGTLLLDKTAGVNAVGGNVTINGGGLRFNADNQIPDAATVAMTGSASLLNSDTNGFTVRSHVETIANLLVDGGKFNSGAIGSNWNITTSGALTGGAGQTLFIINSGGIMRFGGLSLTAMTGSVESTPNAFTVFGNNTSRQTAVTVGAGGLTLDGSRVNLFGGFSAAGALGSRLVLDGDVTTIGTATSTIGRGTFTSGTGNGEGQVTVELSSTAGSVTRSFTIGGGGANLDVLLPITNGSATTAGVRKLGSGILTLGTANTYNGATTIAAGTLALGVNGSFANSPTITVGDAGSSGAVLDISAKTGTFTFSGSQTVGGIGTLKMDAGDTARFAGTFAPGNSPGIFTFDGGTALLSGTTQIEIFGAGRGTGYDAVDLINAATLDYGNGVLALDFGSWLASPQSYQLFGNGSSSVLGGFSSVTIAGSNYTGLTFTGSNGVWTSQGTSPANQTLTFTEATGTLVIVPEPGALALAGIGGAMAAWAARRRR